MAELTTETRTRFKDPDASIDYTFDWANWLPSGTTISSATVTADSGITAAAATNDDTTVTTRVSGGSANTTYGIVCDVTLSTGETDQVTGYVAVREQ